MASNPPNEVIVIFRTKYTTYPGQILFVIGDHPLLGSWSRSNAKQMTYFSRDDFNWEVEVRFPVQPDHPLQVEYKYIVLSSHINNFSNPYYDIRLDKSAEVCWDTGPNRRLIMSNNRNQPLVINTGDLFQPPISMIHNLFFKMPFTDVIYKHGFNPEDCVIKPPDNSDQMIQIRFRVIALQIPPRYEVYITGSHPLFKKWQHFEPLTAIGSYYWEYKIDIPKDTPNFFYKYLVMEEGSETPIWEQRRDRPFCLPSKLSQVVVYYDWMIQGPPQHFRGAGLLVGLFSVHSKQSVNKIGEFPDIKLLVDWAVKANLLMIQLLPMQDTNCYFVKNEESISRQVSAFAFNPMYLALRCIDGYEPVDPPFERDFISVSKFKLQQLRIIFDTKVDKNKLRSNEEFQIFVKNNIYWIPSYCLWCAIRDEQIQKNPGIQPNWPPIENCNPPDFFTNFFIPSPTNFNNVNEFVNDSQTDFFNCSDPMFMSSLFHCWVQFQCHIQLSEATKYAIENRIVLSCTMTIGHNLLSSECWAHPNLFDRNYTIGAPPDIFSFHGQNWFYPAWKWDQMRQNDFEWLRNQMHHREAYFQAATFDHPLGFFRCWNIPSNTDNPLFGHFVPSIPFRTHDLYDLNIRDISRLFRPIFPMSDVQSFAMPEPTKQLIIDLLAVKEGDIWRFNPNLHTDRDIVKVFKELKQNRSLEERLQLALAKKIILSSYESICLIPDFTRQNEFYPRYAMTDSTVFKTLPEREAQILYKMFIDFYYRSNISIWHENGHQKLCVLASSPMQFYGYDLGVSLSDEEKALHRVGICSYHAQRVPREPTLRFDQTSNFPYLSVCTPSSHDMPHLSIWWRNEQADVQQFYHQVLKMEGAAPLSLCPKIANAIVNMHLNANSMWCFLLFEDLFALTDEFQDVQQLDHWMVEPDATNKCGYRLGISLEKLIERHESWTQSISQMVEESNRGRKLSFT